MLKMKLEGLNCIPSKLLESSCTASRTGQAWLFALAELRKPNGQEIVA
jgi:hypothetical protein